MINILLKAKFAKTTVTVRQIQKTAGTLNFLCNTLPAGLPFLKSLYTLTHRSDARPMRAGDRRSISAAVAGDLDIFKMFLENDHHYLRQIPFTQPQLEDSAQYHVFTDAAGHPKAGAGMVPDNEWAQLFWKDTNLFKPNFKPNILVLEAYAAVLSIFIWQQKFAGCTVVLHCDNIATVYSLKNKKSQVPAVMDLIKQLTILCLQMGITIIPVHIQGTLNTATDLISRNQLATLKRWFPYLQPRPQPAPCPIWPPKWTQQQLQSHKGQQNIPVSEVTIQAILKALSKKPPRQPTPRSDTPCQD